MRTGSSGARRVAAGLSAFSVAIALTACGSSETPAGANGASTPNAGQADQEVVALLPQSVKDKGELVIGTEAQYPPFEFYDTDNKTIIGFDPDIGAGLARLMGLKLVLTDAAFASIIPSLTTGRYTLGMSGFAVTAERAKQVDLVTYYLASDGALVMGGNPQDLHIDDSLCGVKVAVGNGTSQQLKTVPRLNEGCEKAGKPKLVVSAMPGSNEVALALSSRRVDVALMGGSTAGLIAKQSKGKFEIASGEPINPTPDGIASQKGTGMDKAVQKALEKMLADGSYKKTLAKWGMDAGAIDSVKINEVTS